MATDVAEFLGAALGLNLLFHVPLLPAGFITGVIAFALLELQRHGFRRFELAITALLGLILLGFLYETVKIGPVGERRRARARPPLRRPGLGLSRGRDHRRDRHAARDLSPLGADEGTDARAQRGRAEARAPLRADRRDRRARSRRAREHGDARRRREALPRHARAGRTSTRSRARTRASPTSSAGRRHSPSRSRCFASGASSSSVGTYAGQVVMAGFVNLRHLALRPARADDDPGARRARRSASARRARSSSARSCSPSGSRSPSSRCSC